MSHSPAISVQNLRKVFHQDIRATSLLGMVKNLFYRPKKAFDAVKSISFTVQKGEFVGFVGPNGAGKTTTLKMLSGILHPTSGEAEVLGFVPWKRNRAFQKQLSLIMGQKNQMWWDLPVIESFAFNKVVYEIDNAVYHRQKNELVELLGIGHCLDVPVRKLSLGERMKCELATALLHEPAVLLLDEPTIGLDVVSQKAIRDFLLEYNRRQKATILLTSHYMEDIRRLCDRVIIIDHGQLIYDGDYRTLVDTRAPTKTIEMVLSEDVPREKFEAFGKVTEFRKGFCRITVPRTKVSKISSELLKSLPIDDISIHEETMEEIVSGIFRESTKFEFRNTK